MSKETPTPAAGVMLGRYRVEAELGRGGMGVVYSATDETLARRVAVKTLSAGLLGRDREARMTRFQREVRALAQLDHSSILHIYDAGEADDPVVGWVLYYSMELIEGETLSERLIRCGAMDVGPACAVVQQCADALGSAHKRGIVHRDVKPANIFLAPGGRVVVADFGVCKIEGGQEITRKDQMVGTPSYLAPEQILGLPVDPRTDVFALGALLYVLISNSALRPQLDRAGLSKLAATDDAAWRARHMPNSTEALRAVVARALSRESSDRFASGTELAEALEPFATRAPDPFEKPVNGVTTSGTRNPVHLGASSDGSGAFTSAGNTDPGGPPPAEPGAGDTQVDSAPPAMVSDEIPARARRLAQRVNAAKHGPAEVEATDPRATVPPPPSPAPVKKESSSRLPMPKPPQEKSDPTQEQMLPPPGMVSSSTQEATDHVRKRPPPARAPLSTQMLVGVALGTALVVTLVAVGVWSVGRGPPPALPVVETAVEPVKPAETVVAPPVASPEPTPEVCEARLVPLALEREAKGLVEKALPLEKKDPRKALQMLQKAVSLDGQNWAAHLATARILVAQKQPAAARDHYRCVALIRATAPEGAVARQELANLTAH